MIHFETVYGLPTKHPLSSLRKKAKTTTLPKPNVRNDTGLLEDTIITKSITNKKKKQSTTASASTESTSFMRPFTSNVQNKQKRTLRQGEKVAGGVT